MLLQVLSTRTLKEREEASLESAAIQGTLQWNSLEFSVLTHLKLMGFFLLFKEGTEYFSASPRLVEK